MRKDESGSILIEFVGSFLLFVLLIGSILSLVNIVTVQARVHYALTQTANTLSMYGYVLNVLGMDKALMNIDKGAGTVRNEINTSIDEINEVLGEVNNLSLSGVQKSAGTVMDRFEGWASSTSENPKQTLQLIAQFGLGEITSAGLALGLWPLMLRYLANGSLSGEEYLASARIDKLEFYSFRLPSYTPAEEGELVGSFDGIADSNSALLDQNGNVKLTVQYEVEYSFFGLKIPWGEGNPTLKISQSVMTKMWLGGSGEGYSG